MTVNSVRTLLVFGALYCATQGALDSWDEAYELSYLSAYDVPVQQIALAQTLGVLPMAIKGLLSLPSDVLRLRTPFIACGLLLSGSMFIVKITFNPNVSFWAYCLCLMLRNAGAAVSDGASDGLTIDADIEALSGTLSAWQGVGRMAGLILSTAIGGALAGEGSYEGFRGTLLFLGAWMLISAPVALIVREELTPTPAGQRVLAIGDKVLTAATCGLNRRCRRKKDNVGTVVVKGGEIPAEGANVALNPLRDMAGSASPLVQPGTPVLPASPGPSVDTARAARLQKLLAASGGAPSGGEAAAAASADGSAGQAGPDGALPPLTLSVPGNSVDISVSSVSGASSELSGGSGGVSPKDSTGQGEGGAAGAGAGGEQLDGKEAWKVLAKHMRRTPVAAFAAFMFTGQLATYIASFPVVLWLQERKGFSVAEVGYITVVGAFGNMAGCYIAGVGFDWIPVKRIALLIATLLSCGPYLLFLVSDGKPELYTVWTVISFGYGALYTVQVSQMRLLADKSVAAAYAGLCMGTLAAAAAVGTYSGGLMSEYLPMSYESCYVGGAIASLVAVLLIPWITAEDPEMQALRKKQRAERRRAEGRKARRRSSFAAWVSKAAGREKMQEEMEGEEDDSGDALLGEGGEASPSAGPMSLDDARKAALRAPSGSGASSERRTLRKPALGSMKNLLDPRLHEDKDSLSARTRAAVRTFFDDSAAAKAGKQAMRRLSNSMRRLSGSFRGRPGDAQGADWATSSSTVTTITSSRTLEVASVNGQGGSAYGVDRMDSGRVQDVTADDQAALLLKHAASTDSMYSATPMLYRQPTPTTSTTGGTGYYPVSWPTSVQQTQVQAGEADGEEPEADVVVVTSEDDLGLPAEAEEEAGAR